MLDKLFSKFKIEYVFITLMTIVMIGVVDYFGKTRPEPTHDSRGNEINVADLTVEEVEKYSGTWFTMLASDNDSICFDINAKQFDGDSTFYFILPEDSDLSHIIFYVRDTYDQFCQRIEGDFSNGPIQVGSESVGIKITRFPLLQMQISQDSPSFSTICDDGLGETIGFGDLAVRTTNDFANENACYRYINGSNSKDDISKAFTLKPRGNATWAYPKHPFSIVFDKPVSLLGMKKHKGYNLIANAKDKSLLKNAVIIDMAKELGVKYQCEYRFVTLFANGQYQGVYMLTSKNRVGKNEINLKPGDYLVNWGGTDLKQPIFYESKMEWLPIETENPYFDIIWPEEDDNIDEKEDFLIGFVRAMEDVDSSDLFDYIDLNSFLRYYWIQEFSMNMDMDYRSVYMYFSSSDRKLHMEPVWDYDMTFGVDETRFDVDLSNPVGWKARNYSWLNYLYNHEVFKTESEKYYNEYFRDAMIHARDSFESQIAMMAEDGQLDLNLWGQDTYGAIQYDTDSYEEWCEEILRFIDDRILFIDGEMSS